MVLFSMTLSDHSPRFQGHGVTIDTLVVLYAQLTRDLFAIAKFLVGIGIISVISICSRSLSVKMLLLFTHAWKCATVEFCFRQVISVQFVLKIFCHVSVPFGKEILTVWRNGEKMLATVYVPVLWYDSANRYGESRAPARDHSSPFSATDWHDVKK